MRCADHRSQSPVPDNNQLTTESCVRLINSHRSLSLIYCCKLVTRYYWNKPSNRFTKPPQGTGTLRHCHFGVRTTEHHSLADGRLVTMLHHLVGWLSVNARDHKFTPGFTILKHLHQFISLHSGQPLDAVHVRVIQKIWSLDFFVGHPLILLHLMKKNSVKNFIEICYYLEVATSCQIFTWKAYGHIMQTLIKTV